MKYIENYEISEIKLSFCLHELKHTAILCRSDKTQAYLYIDSKGKIIDYPYYGINSLKYYVAHEFPEQWRDISWDSWDTAITTFDMFTKNQEAFKLEIQFFISMDYPVHAKLIRNSQVCSEGTFKVLPYHLIFDKLYEQFIKKQ